MLDSPQSSKSLSLEQEAASEETSQLRLEELARSSTELCRIVATNPSAAPELLRELGYSADEITRRSITSNPNTPVEDLLELGTEFPEEFLNNPILPLVVLENPNFLADISQESLLILLKHDAVPSWFLEWVTNLDSEEYEEVFLALLVKPDVPQNALSKLTRSQNLVIAQAAKLHVNLAGEMDEGWEEAAKAAIQTTLLYLSGEESFLHSIGIVPEFLVSALPGFKDRYLSVAKNPDTSPQILQSLVENTEFRDSVAAHIAENPNAPAAALKILLGDENDRIRDAVACHPNTPLSVLQEYQQQLANIKNPVTSAETLSELATSPWVEIRKGVAFHPNTPQVILERLAQDESWRVKTAVALNINTPSWVLEQLAQNETEPVCEAVACNPHTPGIVLEKLCEVGYCTHCSLIAEHPNTSANILEKLATNFQGIREGVARNSNTPVSLLLKLAQDACEGIRVAVVGNPKTPHDAIASLKIDPDYDVRFAAVRRSHQDAEYRIKPPIPKWFSEYPITLRTKAKDLALYIRVPVLFTDSWMNDDRPLLPLSTHQLQKISLEQLVEDAKSQDNEVRIRVAINPNTPIDLLEKLANDEDDYVRRAAVTNSNASVNILEKLGLDTNSDVREVVAYHPHTPVTTLTQLAEDRGWHIRKAVASHPNAPASVLNKLAEDPTEEVKRAVFENVIRFFNNLEFVSIFQKLAEDQSIFSHFSSIIASHPNTPKSILERLAKGKCGQFIAANSNTPINVLLQLARNVDGSIQREAIANLWVHLTTNSDISSTDLEQITAINDIKLKTAIARYPKTSNEILEQLARDSSCNIRTVVAQNPNLSLHTLKQLLKDEDSYVSKAALATYLQNFSENQNTPNSILEQWQVVQNPKAPPKVLVKLAKSPCLIVRENVASHPQASTKLLHQLALDNCSRVRFQVAQNPKTPANLLQQLSQDRTERVRMAIAQNPNTPTNVLEELACDYEWHSNIHQAAVKNLIQRRSLKVGSILESYITSDEPPLTRFLVFLHPLAPSSLLMRNFRSLFWHERYAIAQNPNTPTTIRQQLAQDSNCLVRAAAKANL
ncbi:MULTISPECIES: HEAT repeat domain-containing protein [Nostocales]|uniref:HEAT repeat domain-containing protein n=3 Tax=Nostocales TaxID=1161 RepID=A0A0C1MZQ4_9CYAN|nr:HEAT repeat domain-containing protein [Tolypothrix bouteillei]KAF3888683.1 HEAT repeat domain-containing protein [Tolypothrix bouteillei VB521301]